MFSIRLLLRDSYWVTMMAQQVKVPVTKLEVLNSMVEYLFVQEHTNKCEKKNKDLFQWLLHI